MPVYHVCTDAQGGQKRALDPLELELWVIVSHHVSARNPDWVLCKSSQCSSYCWSIITLAPCMNSLVMYICVHTCEDVHVRAAPQGLQKAVSALELELQAAVSRLS